jgi:glucose/mannose-6-phosphate isomerase
MTPVAVKPNIFETRCARGLLAPDRPQTSILDNGDTYARLDREGMLGRIAALPEQIEAAWLGVAAAELPPSFARPERVVMLGMGGSGIGGSLLQALAVDLRARTPVFTVRGYALPAFVDRRSLVLACATSGHTEETISAVGEAIAAHIPCAVIAPGGPLVDLARAHRLPAFTYDWDGGARAALGWSFGTLLALCARSGVLPRAARDLPRALDAMRYMRAHIEPDIPEAMNEAKRLARRLAGRLPLVVGAEALAPVAYRWRTQINENAGSWAIADELPDMHHHAQAGFQLPRPALPLLHAVFLRQASMHERIRLRLDATVAELRASGVTAEALDISGSNILAQQLSAVLFGDFVSYYLAMLNDVPPSPVDATARLDVELAASRAEPAR